MSFKVGDKVKCICGYYGCVPFVIQSATPFVITGITIDKGESVSYVGDEELAQIKHLSPLELALL